MIVFIIALFVKKGLIDEKEGEKLAKSIQFAPLPSEFEDMLAFIERHLTEAKISSTRKYYIPEEVEEKKEKTVPKKVAQKKN